MDITALEQAKSRLAKARRALDALKMAADFETAEDAWTDFLIAVSAVYSKLDQGSKGQNKSTPWFGSKKKERRDDPLLRYLHYARNSNEHGIARVVEQTPSNRVFGRTLKFGERVPVMIHPAAGPQGPVTGQGVEAIAAGPTLKPIRACDTRFNVCCDPPKEHRGQSIKYGGNFVYDIGELAVEYLQSMVSEAEKLV
jgi:hypothetical protein